MSGSRVITAVGRFEYSGLIGDALIRLAALGVALVATLATVVNLKTLGPVAVLTPGDANALLRSAALAGPVACIAGAGVTGRLQDLSMLLLLRPRSGAHVVVKLSYLVGLSVVLTALSLGTVFGTLVVAGGRLPNLTRAWLPLVPGLTLSFCFYAAVGATLSIYTERPGPSSTACLLYFLLGEGLVGAAVPEASKYTVSALSASIQQSDLPGLLEPAVAGAILVFLTVLASGAVALRLITQRRRI